MWILKHETGKNYYLKTDKEYILGRSNCDIILSNDTSVSRKHALVKSDRNKIILKDLGSKYGTYLKNDNFSKKVDANKDIYLDVNEQIRFGMQFHRFTIAKTVLQITASNVTKLQKETLKKFVAEFGGQYYNEWNESLSHVTTDTLLLTVKLTCAIVAGQHIVTTKYWEAFANSIKHNKELPNVKDFIPPLGENMLDSNTPLDFKPERKRLFTGKTFLFPNKTLLEQIKILVVITGGKVDFWDSYDKYDFIKPNFIIIRPDTFTDTQSTVNSTATTDIEDFLKEHGKRCIPSYEISLAIINCSCEKKCNPDFISNLIDTNTKEKVIKDSDILVAETPQDNINEASSISVTLDELKSYALSESETNILDEMKIEKDSTILTLASTCSSSKRRIDIIDHEEYDEQVPKRIKQEIDVVHTSPEKITCVNVTSAPHPEKSVPMFTFKNKFSKLKKSSLAQPTCSISNVIEDEEVDSSRTSKRHRNNINVEDDQSTECEEIIKRIKYEPDMNDSIVWCSKALKNCTIKSVVQLSELSFIYSKQLENTIQVVTIPLIVNRPRIDTNTMHSTVPNFKKFKKVQPKISHEIISIKPL